MLTVHIYYKGVDGNAKLFVNEMISNGFVDFIRNEEGNLRYEYYFPIDDKETVLLVDSWESHKALDRHHQLPIMNEIIKLREKYDLHMKVEKYESVDDSKDDKYIRK